MAASIRFALPVMVAATALAAACGSPSQEANTPFIATQGDFAGFRTWEAFDGGVSADDSLDGGQRMIYLNHRPPAGSTRFPLGTILVKTTEGGPTFAMAHRGDGFNPVIDNWEWFELAETGDHVQILWRGMGPNGTLGYAGTEPTGCTDCHLFSFKNDYVAGTSVSLSTF